MLFTFIFDLELMTLEKGKNARIRPLFWQNRRLGVGVLFRRITVSKKWPKINLKATQSTNFSLMVIQAAQKGSYSGISRGGVLFRRITVVLTKIIKKFELFSQNQRQKKSEFLIPDCVRREFLFHFFSPIPLCNL